jgi:hypothetical protein
MPSAAALFFLLFTGQILAGQQSPSVPVSGHGIRKSSHAPYIDVQRSNEVREELESESEA